MSSHPDTLSESKGKSFDLIPEAVLERLKDRSKTNSKTETTQTLQTAKESNNLAFGATEGVIKPPEYCLNLAVKLAQAKVREDEQAAKYYEAELTATDGDCDPHFITEIGLKYAEYLINSHLFGKTIPYIDWKKEGENIETASIIEDKLHSNATVAIIGDWGTGQTAALNVLEQIAEKNPDVVIHLGDTYYSGTEYEVENYFTKPFEDIFKTKKPLIYNLTGNHDMYSGAEAYYTLIKTLNQPSSYFCPRNENWQFLAMDTSYNCLKGGNTYLEPTEIEWIKDKINNFSGKTVLLSHHQLFSADDSFLSDEGKDSSYNATLFGQFADLLDKVTIWFWGHEHNMFIFDEYFPGAEEKSLKKGRCLGASAFPIGEDEIIPEVHKWKMFRLIKM